MRDPKRVAIVGSGCTGIGALWALKRTNHEVHLYEADDRLGGHTNTVTFEHNGKTTKVDTGFIVMNSATYRSPIFRPLESPVSKLTPGSQLYRFSQANRHSYGAY